MAHIVLSHSSAFNPSSDLWIVSEGSKWAKKLDWYLNFQIVKSSRHTSREIGTELNQYLEAAGLDYAPNFTSASHLLISSQHLLPNKWVLVLPDPSNWNAWVKDLHSTWLKINKPTLRVFLPAGKTAADFTPVWQSQSDYDDYTIVLD
jgi:hypothetical protein